MSYNAANAGMQTLMPGWGQMLPATVASTHAADWAASVHGRSNCHVPCDTHHQGPDSVGQCSTAPLLEIPVNTNCASAFEQRECHACEGRKAGIQFSGKIGLGAPAQQQSTDSKLALKHRPGSGKNCNIVGGGSTISSIRHTGQHSAANQAKTQAISHATRQWQGRGVMWQVSKRNMLPKDIQLSSVGHTDQQGRCLGSQPDSRVKQTTIAGRGERGDKASSSSADRRKALLKAIVRTTPTRAPSLPSEASQSSINSAAISPSIQPRFRGTVDRHSHSSNVSGGMLAQSRQLPTGQSHGTGMPMLPYLGFSGLEAELRSGASRDPLGSIARSCKVFPHCGSAPTTKETAGSVGSAERRAVRRSLLSQPDFC